MSTERILDYNADVAEFCPHTSVENVLAVGTYELDQTSRTRHGKLYVFRLVGDIRDGQLGLEDPSAIQLPGIFDMSWVSSKVSDGAQVAVALADSTVAIFNVCDLEGRIGMQDICRMDFGEGEMVLAVDTCTTAAASSLCASGSMGNVAIFNLSQGCLGKTRFWHAHDLECWTCCHHPTTEWLIYSGGDDSMLKGWDLRQEDVSMIFCQRKAHTAGVCCIAPHPFADNQFCTGSYDGRLRLWDSRVLHNPLCFAQVDVGGGVWRAKWHPHIPGYVLCAAMHNGFQLVEVDGPAGRMNCVESYQEHGSLAYGVDWCRSDGPYRSVVASCSFYDRLLRIWVPSALRE
eukprot:jgi/Botrbrau1/13739/Bobra.0356s0015.1